MSGDVHVRFCERLGVKLPRPTLLVVLVSGHWNWWKLPQMVEQRLKEELVKLDLTINQEKTKWVDMTKGETFGFLGFDFRRVKTWTGKWGIHRTPKKKARKALTQKLKEVFRRNQSQPLVKVVEVINPILRGWVNYFRIGQSSIVFDRLRNWVEMKIRRHLQRASHRRCVGWKRWSREWLYNEIGLYHDYRYYQKPTAAPAARAT